MNNNKGLRKGGPLSLYKKPKVIHQMASCRVGQHKSSAISYFLLRSAAFSILRSKYKVIYDHYFRLIIFLKKILNFKKKSEKFKKGIYKKGKM